MIGFFRFLKGYLRIRVWGYSPERFMNLCCNHDILLWDIEKCADGSYNMNISLSGYFQIRPFVRKTGTKVAVLNKFGLPFFIPHIKLHSFFLAGIVGTFLFLFWTTGYIWKIEMTGNDKILTEDLMEFLEEQDIKIGSKKNIVQVEDLEKALRTEFPNITWTSVQVEGTKLWIQIKENDKIFTAEEKTEEVSDLVASKDGIVSSIITRNGVPMVKAGDEVKAGDILVSGQVPIYNDAGEIINYQLYAADADVYLECSYRFQATMPISYILHEYTGKEYKSLYLKLFDKEIAFPDYSDKENCDITQDRKQFRSEEHTSELQDRKQLEALEQWFLPFFYGVDKYTEYNPVKAKYSKEEVARHLNEEINTFIRSLEEKGVQIIKKNVTINKNQKKWQMNMDFQIVEKTGKNVAIIVGEE